MKQSTNIFIMMGVIVLVCGQLQGLTRRQFFELDQLKQELNMRYRGGVPARGQRGDWLEGNLALIEQIRRIDPPTAAMYQKKQDIFARRVVQRRVAEEVEAELAGMEKAAEEGIVLLPEQPSAPSLEKQFALQERELLALKKEPSIMKELGIEAAEILAEAILGEYAKVVGAAVAGTAVGATIGDSIEQAVAKAVQAGQRGAEAARTAAAAVKESITGEQVALAQKQIGTLAQALTEAAKAGLADQQLGTLAQALTEATKAGLADQQLGTLAQALTEAAKVGLADQQLGTLAQALTEAAKVGLADQQLGTLAQALTEAALKGMIIKENILEIERELEGLQAFWDKVDDLEAAFKALPELEVGPVGLE